jgi:undecaprenyl diphosphate synthase
MSKENIDLSNLPAHVAVIMDGNGRWAQKRKLPRIFGHRAAIKSVREIVETCAKLKLGVLTLYAFSTENWTRPRPEVSALMHLLKAYLEKELKTMMENDIRLTCIGDISKLPEGSRNELKSVMAATSGNRGMILNLALNYGGRHDIVQAVNKIIKKGVKEIDEETFGRYLYTEGLPDPDLLIRTSGEMRISNFLLWQCAYTEFYITETLWPDFREKDLYAAIADYQKRERRFGGVKQS